MNPKFTIIIVNYNSGDQVKDLIMSIDTNIASKQIIIIDNASIDNSRDILAKICLDEMLIVWNDENIGFGRANNIGAKIAQGEFLIFINPDSKLIEDTNMESYFLNYLSDSEVGIVAPKIIYPDGTVQPSWVQRYSTLQTFIAQLLSLGAIYRRLRSVKLLKWMMSAVGNLLFPNSADEYIHRFEEVSQAYSCCWVSGACFAIRKELFNKIGGFDDRFFLYSEDEDLCRRLKIYGKKIIYDPTIRVCHDVGGTSIRSSCIGVLGQASASKIESGLIYLRKYTEKDWEWVKWSYIIVVTLRLTLGFYVVMSPRKCFQLLTRLIQV